MTIFCRRWNRGILTLNSLDIFVFVRCFCIGDLSSKFEVKHKVWDELLKLCTKVMLLKWKVFDENNVSCIICVHVCKSTDNRSWMFYPQKKTGFVAAIWGLICIFSHPFSNKSSHTNFYRPTQMYSDKVEYCHFSGYESTIPRRLLWSHHFVYGNKSIIFELR